MFGGLFKKTRPKYYLVEQPETRVLLLPAVFADNELTHQVFSLADRRALIRLFEKRGVDHRSHEFGDEDVRLSAHVLQMGEKFQSNSNDLHDYAEDVREFEFFAVLPAREERNAKAVEEAGESLNRGFSEPFEMVGTSGELLADIGIETMGGGFIPLFMASEGTICSRSQIFSTSDDGQREFVLSLAARFGNGQIVKLGVYSVSGILPARRGVPQIQVVITLKADEMQIEATDSSSGDSLKVTRC